MLFAQAGMSAEKTAALIDVWPTASHFWHDIQQRKRYLDGLPEPEMTATGRKKKGTPSGETLIKERCSTGGTRDIGPALSKGLWELFVSVSGLLLHDH